MATEHQTQANSQGPVTRSKALTISKLLMILILAVGGTQMAIQYYRDITSSQMPDNYTPITNQNTESFVLFKKQLEAEGIKADLSEMSVFLITEAAFKYKWQRGNDVRVYVIRRNAGGLWDAFLQ